MNKNLLWPAEKDITYDLEKADLKEKILNGGPVAYYNQGNDVYIDSSNSHALIFSGAREQSMRYLISTVKSIIEAGEDLVLALEEDKYFYAILDLLRKNDYEVIYSAYMHESCMSMEIQ